MSTSVLPVILLCSLGVPGLLCDPVDVSVRRGQNVTLPCHLNSSAVLAWYRLQAHRMTLLLSATRGRLPNTAFIVDQNEDGSRFVLQAGGGPERLLISGVTDADLGLYFCAAGLGLSNMRFGTAVRLSLTGAEQRLASDAVGFSALWICVCVCVTCGFCGFLSACVLRYRKGSSLLSCINGVKMNSNVQAAPVQYSSLRFIQRSRPAPAPGDVTYATIAKHTP